MANKRQAVCVIVAGMHRSGTSALTRVLSLLGCSLPANLLDANPTNETGHWEPAKIMELNDRLLASAGCDWDDWTAVPSDWFQSLEAAARKEEAADTFRAEYPNAGLTVLKDPRICRLLPFWFDVLKDIGVDPVVAVPVRNPLEVARSLSERDLSDPYHNRLLWIRHVVDAERYSRGVPRYFCSYDGLLENWSAVTSQMADALNVRWPRVSAQTVMEVEAFLKPQLRHHQLNPSLLIRDRTESDWLKTTYSVVSRWAEAGEDEEGKAALDRVSAALDEAGPAFSVIGLKGRAAATRLRLLEQEHAELRAFNEQALAEASSTLTDVMSDRSRLEADLQAAQVERKALRAELEGVAASLQRVEVDRDNLQTDAQSQAEAARLELEALARALKAAEERSGQLETELNGVRGMMAGDAAAHVEQLEQERSHFEETRKLLEARTAELEALQSDLRAAEAAVVAAQDSLKYSASEADALRSTAEDLERRLRAAEGLSAELTAKMEALEVRHRDELEAQQRESKKLVDSLRDNVNLLLHDLEGKEDLRRALEQAEQRLDDFAARLALKGDELDRAESALRQRGAEVDDAYAEIRAMKSRLDTASDEKDRLERTVEALKSNIHLLFSDLEEKDRQISTIRSQTDALVGTVEDNRRRVSHLLSDAQVAVEALVREIVLQPSVLIQGPRAALRRKGRLLKRAGIVDPDWYSSTYPDVVSSGLPPEEHFVLHGYLEGRKPRR